VRARAPSYPERHFVTLRFTPSRFSELVRWAKNQAKCLILLLERAKGLEPSTPTLARSCSTTELHPHPKALAVQIAPATAVLCQMRTANATV
jgi:hypothetical protein